MKTVTVNASHTYEIFIKRGLLKDCGHIIADTVKAKTFAVITDDNVDKLYSDTVINSLSEKGFSVVKFVFPHGETSKSLYTLSRIYSFLCENHLTHSDCLIALGGGVVGDITGFASATYLRGIDYIQIPTTLLAQIDSSVGGKTAIDLPNGKNLVGAFKQPACVICDPDTLNTLDRKFLSDGMAEAIKYGCIRDYSLFRLIEEHNLDTIKSIADELIFRCVSIKKEVVEHDEFDKGERMILNFGHTLGHAVESFYHYETYTHGNAVAVGMCLMAERCEKNNIHSHQITEELVNCCKKYELAVSVPAPLDELVPLCFNDKKCEGKNINIIICAKLGHSEVQKKTIEEFKKFMGV